jgi:voltage-gated potassium channel Kch
MTIFSDPFSDERQSDTAKASSFPFDTIVFGLGRYGRNLAQELQRYGQSVLGVDFDPERVASQVQDNGRQ